MSGATPANPKKVAMTEPTPTEPKSATPPAEPAPVEPAKTPPPATGDGLGDAGRKALEALRAKNDELERKFKAIGEAFGTQPGQSKAAAAEEYVAQMQELRARLDAAELKAVRSEVAAEKGLTPAQAARLQGATREELAADADALKSLFPAPAPGTPAPDPTQGARGGPSDLEARLAEAQKAGNTREAIRLKTALAEQKRT